MESQFHGHSQRYEDSSLVERQGDRALYQSTLWWFTSTAFPLIAGTFGPIANLFSICALVQAWRVDNANGSGVPDPPWLIALNSCSLLLAILANLILLFNFARRIRYALAQPLTISLWYLSSVFLTIPICLTRLKRLLPSTHHFSYSQSFYYALISASLHFTISTLLLLNFIGASRFVRAYPPTFAALTYAQRTLMLQTIYFSLYLALGAAVFSTIEGWHFADGVYWADYTLLTIGLGTDFPLKRTLGRMLLIPYAPFGIILLGLVVRSVRELVLERAKEKVVMRRLERRRDRWMDNFSKTLGTKEEVRELTASRPRSLLFCWRRRRDKKFHLPQVIANAETAQRQEQHTWHHAEFQLMRYIQITAEKSERYITLVASLLAFLVVWVGGSLVFWICEYKLQRWTYTESLYFTYTTILTIGYGDFYPESPAGKPFFVLWSLIAVPTVTVLIENMGNTVVRSVQDVTDWMGRRTVLPEYRENGAKKEEERMEAKEKKDQASLESDNIKERPSTLGPTLTMPEPSLSLDRTLPVRSYAGLPLTSSSGEGLQASQVESPLEPRDEGKAAVTDQNLQQSEGEHDPSQIQTEAALLAREISKLAKDVCQQPSKKYGWEEWVNWLKMLGDEEVGGIMELDDEVSANLPETSANHHKLHHRYHSRPNAQFENYHGIEDGERRHWTWLDDKGPLFSHQTETEWILLKLCSRLERLTGH